METNNINCKRYFQLSIRGQEFELTNEEALQLYNILKNELCIVNVQFPYQPFDPCYPSIPVFDGTTTGTPPPPAPNIWCRRRLI